MKLVTRAGHEDEKNMIIVPGFLTFFRAVVTRGKTSQNNVVNVNSVSEKL